MHEIAAINLSKIYFLKDAKKTCKPNNRDLNGDWITMIVITDCLALFEDGTMKFVYETT